MMSDLDRETSLHRGAFLELRRRGRWEYVRRTRSSGAAAFLIAVTDARELLLVEQYREAVQCRMIELPAGIIGDDNPDESPEQAAHRELLEETGYQAAQARRVLDAPTAAGLSSEWAHFLRMTGLTRVHAGGGVDDEDITTHHVPLDRADVWLAEQQDRGERIDPRIFAALYWLSKED